MSMQKKLVICESLVKIYKAADLEVVALQGLDLEVKRGEMIAIVGASGSGKSTLLNILGGLDEPSAGTCMVAGHNLMRLTETQRTLYRGIVVGHLWQQSGRNLRPELTITANVELIHVLNGVGRRQRKQRTRELLEMIGIAHLADKKATQLSGGEQQRAALAVALAHQPALLLADEPTGELDSVTARTIIALMRQFNRQLGLTMIIVTHDAAVAAEVDRTIAIRDGRTSTEIVRRNIPLSTPTASANSEQTGAIIGLSTRTHRESIIVDRAGRLQLPGEIIEQIDFKGLADVELVVDHVELRPAQTK